MKVPIVQLTLAARKQISTLAHHVSCERELLAVENEWFPILGDRFLTVSDLFMEVL